MKSIELTTEQLAEIAGRYYERNKANHYGHKSHLAADALEHAQMIADKAGKGFAGYHGVEGCRGMLYLNAGDTYTPTVLAIPGLLGGYSFAVGDWGTYVEEMENEKD